MLHIRTAIIGLVLACAPAAWAQPASPGIVIDDSCADVPATHAADDRAAIDALTAITQRGYPGLAAHIERLRAIADRLPSCYPQITRRGDTIVVRSNDQNEGTALMFLMTTTQQGAQVSLETNTYPLILLLLASNDVEMQRYNEAIVWLDRGLALQPNSQELRIEYNAALLGLRRYEESRALLQGLLDDPAFALTLDRASTYRGLGVTLIDMNRLDEAEAALRESDRLDPNNRATLNELDYIADLRRGGAIRPTELNAPASVRK